jgi:hypothetical protein
MLWPDDVIAYRCALFAFVRGPVFALEAGFARIA